MGCRFGRVLGWLGPVLLVATSAAQERTGQFPPQQFPGGGQGPAAGTPPAAAQGSRQGVPVPPEVRPAPFQLSREEEQQLWAVLKAWEQRSAGIETARSDFTLWEEDVVFQQKHQRQGEIKFKAPDHGMYRVREAQGRDWAEHWVCDGKALYEYNHAQRQLIQRNLPPELQGQRIVDGPLPFLFGAQAERLLQRYWLRIVTPENVARDQVWIEAYPKLQTDRANYSRARVILTTNGLLPYAVELMLPNGNRRVYQFDWKINERNLIAQLFSPDDFSAPLPRGWTKIVDPEGGRSDPRGATGTPMPPAGNGGGSVFGRQP